MRTTVVADNFPQLVIQGDGGSYTVSIDQGQAWTLGRGKDCHVVLSDRWASRRHALIQQLDNGDYYLIDLGSRNGCLLNGTKISVPTLLKTGDRVTIGKTVFEFRAGQAQTTIPPVPVAKASTRPIVLILQEPTSQSYLWRDLLISQEIDVIVESGEVNCRQILQDFNTMVEGSSALIMVDTRVEKPNVAALITWSQQRFPGMQLLLIDSHDRIISSKQKHWARQQRVLDWLPALPEDNFTVYSAEIEQTLRQILRYLNWGPIRRDKLATALLDLQMNVTDDTPSQWLGEFVSGPGHLQTP